ncbi:unnamed protein product [Polarella glacialis]|uniref:Sushi domain-containing protein n=1 Tax=Polarella glacialis TaxID=89957 RepID=A0A813LD61_POLGL|nr:unnamed protein product [Polarella glacialis]
MMRSALLASLRGMALLSELAAGQIDMACLCPAGSAYNATATFSYINYEYRYETCSAFVTRAMTGKTASTCANTLWELTKFQQDPNSAGNQYQIGELRNSCCAPSSSSPAKDYSCFCPSSAPRWTGDDFVSSHDYVNTVSPTLSCGTAMDVLYVDAMSQYLTSASPARPESELISALLSTATCPVSLAALPAGFCGRNRLHSMYSAAVPPECQGLQEGKCKGDYAQSEYVSRCSQSSLRCRWGWSNSGQAYRCELRIPSGLAEADIPAHANATNATFDVCANIATQLNCTSAKAQSDDFCYGHLDTFGKGKKCLDINLGRSGTQCRDTNYTPSLACEWKDFLAYPSDLARQAQYSGCCAKSVTELYGLAYCRARKPGSAWEGSKAYNVSSTCDVGMLDVKGLEGALNLPLDQAQQFYTQADGCCKELADGAGDCMCPSSSKFLANNSMNPSHSRSGTCGESMLWLAGTASTCPAMSQAYFEAWKAAPSTSYSTGKPTIVSFSSMTRACCSKPLAAAVEAWPTSQCFCPADSPAWKGNTFPVRDRYFPATPSTCASALRVALFEELSSYYTADTITPVAAVGPKLTVLLQPTSSCKAEQDSMPPAACQAHYDSPGKTGGSTPAECSGLNQTACRQTAYVENSISTCRSVTSNCYWRLWASSGGSEEGKCILYTSVPAEIPSHALLPGVSCSNFTSKEDCQSTPVSGPYCKGYSYSPTTRYAAACKAISPGVECQTVQYSPEQTCTWFDYAARYQVADVLRSCCSQPPATSSGAKYCSEWQLGTAWVDTPACDLVIFKALEAPGRLLQEMGEEMGALRNAAGSSSVVAQSDALDACCRAPSLDMACFCVSEWRTFNASATVYFGVRGYEGMNCAAQLQGLASVSGLTTCPALVESLNQSSGGPSYLEYVLRQCCSKMSMEGIVQEYGQPFCKERAPDTMFKVAEVAPLSPEIWRHQPQQQQEQRKNPSNMSCGDLFSDLEGLKLKGVPNNTALRELILQSMDYCCFFSGAAPCQGGLPTGPGVDTSGCSGMVTDQECKVACAVGYDSKALSSSFVYSCLGNGKFVGLDPHCATPKCSIDPAAASGVNVSSCTDVEVGATCMLSCAEHHTPQGIGLSRLTCQADKNFMGTQLVCEPLTCSKSSLPQVGLGMTIQPACLKTTVNAFCNLRCDVGFESSPPSTAVLCLASGSFEALAAAPVCLPKKCPLRGAFLAAHVATSCEDKVEGGTCSSFCAEGFSGSEVQPHSCSDGNFTGSLPASCVAVNCTTNTPGGGSLDGSACSGTTTAGSCNVSCIRGYKSQTQLRSTCLATGSFSQVTDDCSAEQCGSLASVGDFGTLGVTSTCRNMRFGQACLAYCDRGFTMTGAPKNLLCDYASDYTTNSGFKANTGSVVAPVCVGSACTVGFPSARGLQHTCSGIATGQQCEGTALPGYFLPAPIKYMCAASGQVTKVGQGSANTNRASCQDGSVGTNAASTCQRKFVEETCWAYCSAGFAGALQEYVCAVQSNGQFAPEPVGTAVSCARRLSAEPEVEVERRLAGAVCGSASISTAGLDILSLNASSCDVASGEVCIAECATGYSLVAGGKATMYDCNNGALSGTKPNCAPTACNYSLPTGLGVTHNCTGVATGSSCTAQCGVPGYSLPQGAAPQAFQCTASGDFEGTDPTCAPKNCTALTLGTVFDTSGCLERSVGDPACFVICGEGYELVGSAGSYQCLADGSFSGSEPQCASKTCAGSVPGAPTCSNLGTGETCNVSCAAGYSGTPSVYTCGTNGLIAGTTPSCEAEKCLAPTLPAGLNHTCSGIQLGKKCAVGCLYGLALAAGSSESVFTCAVKASSATVEFAAPPQWPKCEAELCKYGMPSATELDQNCSTIVTGQTCSVGCKLGSAGVSTVYNCGADGVVKGSRPTCQVKMCPSRQLAGVDTSSCLNLTYGRSCQVACADGYEAASGAAAIAIWACSFVDASSSSEAMLLGPSMTCTVKASVAGSNATGNENTAANGTAAEKDQPPPAAQPPPAFSTASPLCSATLLATLLGVGRL